MKSDKYTRFAIAYGQIKAAVEQDGALINLAIGLRRLNSLCDKYDKNYTRVARKLILSIDGHHQYLVSHNLILTDRVLADLVWLARCPAVLYLRKSLEALKLDALIETAYLHA